MKVLAISADRSPRGVLFPGTPAARRQEAYAEALGELDIIDFSRRSDGATHYEFKTLRVFPTNSRSRFLYGWDALRIAKRLPRPDVVTAQDPFEAGLAAWLIARRLKVPLHIQVHTDVFSPEYAAHSFANRIRVRIARFLLPRAAGIRVVSERIRNSLRTTHYALPPISVLPIYVDLDRIRTAPAPGALAVRFAAYRKKLLVVARLEPEKNVALALRAFKESAPPSTCLIIVGEGSEREKLESVARELDIRERVFFEGTEDPLPYYRLADLVLVTSRYEGYGLVIAEALAAGVPVLSTDVGCAHEAGAIIASEGLFGQELARWFSQGERSGMLKRYPYESESEYVAAYAENIRATLGDTV
jgi:glycosyltransferase involved in cell wall biosynthesis